MVVGLDKLVITGGNPLHGTIPITGAKNAALKLICASLLTDEKIVLTNAPTTIKDLHSLVNLIETMGVVTTIDGYTATLDAGTITSTVASYELVRKKIGRASCRERVSSPV